MIVDMFIKLWLYRLYCIRWWYLAKWL